MVENIPNKGKYCLENDDSGHATLPLFCLVDNADL